MRKGDDLTTFIVPKVKKIRSLNLPEPHGSPRPVAGHFTIFIFFNVQNNTRVIDFVIKFSSCVSTHFDQKVLKTLDNPKLLWRGNSLAIRLHVLSAFLTLCRNCLTVILSCVYAVFIVTLGVVIYVSDIVLRNGTPLAEVKTK